MVAISIRTCPDCGGPLPYHRKFCNGCRDRRNAARDASYRREHRTSKSSNLFQAYGLTVADFARLLEAQGGICPVCGIALPLGMDLPPWQKPVVDHDHRCCAGLKVKCGGRCIRGVIHARCNRGLGQLGDDPEVYTRAAEYVRRANDRLGLVPVDKPISAAPRRRGVKRTALFDAPH
jgi:hypothetical protein